MTKLITKTISAPTIFALKDALTHIFWRKDDLRNFLNNTIKNRTIVSTLNWDQPKYNIASDLIDRMVQRRDFYFDELIALIQDACSFEEFPHLNYWPDKDKLIKKAKESVQSLRVVTDGYFEVIQERREVEIRRMKNQEKLNTTQSFQDKLEEYRKEFIAFELEPNKQLRGYKFEKFLYNLFNLFDLSPRGAFKVIGEQIDGSFEFENHNFLLEARYVKDQQVAADLYAFHGKIDNKLKTTLGLFIAVNGFSKECLEANKKMASKSIILMDGMDLMNVLEGRVSLKVMLSAKRAAASETGELLHRV